MDKKQLTESDIRARFITRAIEQAGWDPMAQIFHEFGLRAGRISVRGKAAHRDQTTVLKADYALFFKPNIPLAAVEAKDNNHGIGAGMPQAIEYARLLGVPFAFASNGDGFIFRDETLADGVLEKEIALHEFPSPQQLWDRYCAWKGWAPEVRSVAEFDYYPGKTPRYYQINAVILKYFANATHVGLTATPKETKDVSNTDYFGEPVYTYSLKQGIEDGFLAPYKVIRVDLDKDAFGWRPSAGMTDKLGNVIEDRIYTGADMNRKLVLEKRDEVVAAKITEYLKATDRMAKTIVFCEDIDHAERMRLALSNANADLCAIAPNYVVQITGDNAIGKAQLDNFIDPEKPYPVIATTSKLMSTGVDAQTCKLIVLDQNIKSMTLFKQIIGRGTRLREDLGKTWFTILDFKRATDNFADPAFDGEPVQVYEPKGEQPVAPDDASPPSTGNGQTPWTAEEPAPGYTAPGAGTDTTEPKRYVVGGAVNVSVARERVQYLSPEGKLITESLRDYTRINLVKQYDSLDKFLQAWNSAERKAALLQELEGRGVLYDALAEEVANSGIKDLDPFDLLLHVAYNQPPLTRRERANRVKKRNVFAQYGGVARQVIEALIDKYADEGIATLEAENVLSLPPINHLGLPAELIKSFGGRPQFKAVMQTLERELYASSQP